MKRRYWYLASLVVFVPLVLWYAGQFSDLPDLTFAQASMEDDHTKRVMVTGELVADGGINGAEEGMTFYLKDSEGKRERVFYEGKSDFTEEDLTSASSISAIGHMCSDGQGPRFHAKQLHLE